MIGRARQENVVLFVHGFGSSSECWDKMLDLLRSDDRIRSRYELCTWSYPTKWIELQLLGRIPRLQELGRSLADEIDSPRYRNRSLTLVGHSQGGLVIQSYVAELLGKGEGERLRNIRQAILFATPSEGSMTGMGFRRLLSMLIRNPQEATLRVLNPDVSDMKATIRERVVGATTDSPSSWRVPIHAVCGLQDNIVPEASARGPFDSVKRVNGTHFSIIRPTDHTDPRYTETAELLLDPGGHTHRFEIDSYETTLRIEPCELQRLETQGKRKPPFVEFDNVGTMKRTVTFAESNRCKKLFSIRYITRNDGYIVAHPSHPNETSPIEKGQWETRGTFFQFDFTPVRGQQYALDVDVYKGYDESERDVHFHLGRHSHYRRFTFVLDLSAYVANGYVVSPEPSFYLNPTEREHNDLCRQRARCGSLESHPQAQPGVYCWEIEGIQTGVIDVVWDVIRAIPTSMMNRVPAPSHAATC
jgi:pimeloyl-ACP methyl ester carboxylesterase